MTIWIVVYAIGAAQAVLLALALARRPTNVAANRLLAGWLALVGIDLAVKASFLAAPSVTGFRAFLFVAQFPFLHASLFYLYVRTLTTTLPLSLRDGIHAMGFLGSLWLVRTTLLSDDAHLATRLQLWMDGNLPPVAAWSPLVLYGWSLTYIGAALRQVVRYRRDVQERRADADRVSLRWLLVQAVGQIAIWSIAILNDVTDLPGINYFLIYGLVTAWTCALGYYGLIQAPVAAPPPSPPPADSAPMTDDPRFPEVQARLATLMTDDALYLQPALTITQVAKRSGYPEYLVSATINRVFGCTFWDYINRQRVHAARRLLADPNDSRTILDIAYACGFTSKSTFNAVFKRETGDTPSTYRARQSTSGA
ncbi:helix-turn-helix transcriptional regulator [Tahibacter amnicola]|uniref:Helix-turn-helix transcriptional regulator n=1 Tax=Tahibacter amnicola TaxID=2976241 RepID=A0ABY6BLC9_9GAMM|nr:helix-turn-helix transcriptional regulator [Tahibacter amnicola]UXI70282.1 helix-turn-helix transcriptional regulator [Tahibacter amnicola]